MNELDKIHNKLDLIYNSYGYVVLIIVMLMLLLGLLFWLFLKTYFKNYATSFFKQSFAKFQSELIREIGGKFITQQGEIQKDITGLKGEIEKDISQIQSDLNLIVGQKMAGSGLNPLIRLFSDF